MTNIQTIHWHPLPTPEAVAAEAANRILAAADEAIAQRGRFRLVLAGGRTPQATYRLLAEVDADWRRWEIYFGDERCLPPDHAQRNSRMARDSWLDRVDIPAGQVHIIPAELGPEEGARRYEPLVAAALPFDMVLLGLGEDGHTASLFPGHRHLAGKRVIPVHGAPKPPPQRISLSATALGQAGRILAMVTGSAKRDAVDRWQKGQAIPIATIMPLGRFDVLLDAAAEAEK